MKVIEIKIIKSLSALVKILCTLNKKIFININFELENYFPFINYLVVLSLKFISYLIIIYLFCIISFKSINTIMNM